MFRLIAGKIKIDGRSVAVNDCIKSLVYQRDEETVIRVGRPVLRIACIILPYLGAMDDVLYTRSI